MAYNRQIIIFTAVLVTSLVAVVAGMLTRFVPTWQPGYLVGACLLVALESGVAHATFRRDRMWTSELLRYLAPELLIMLVVMRIAATLGLDLATLPADAQRWLLDPISIFDLPFLAHIFTGVFVGGYVHFMMQNLLDLAPKQYETLPLSSSDDYRAAALMSQDRMAALRQISNRFIFGGVVVLISLGLEAVNIDRIAGPSRSISALSGVSALLYLISGFLVYSQGRLAMLQARWQLDGARVAPAVANRWTRASWLIIVGIALATLVLPRTYGLGLLDTIQAVFGALGYVITVLGYLVVYLFSLLALIPAWLLSLLVVDTDAPPAEVQPPPTLPPVPPAIREPQLGPALVFWACMLLLVIYALVTVAQRHPLVASRLVNHGLLGRLLRWLGLTWRETRTWAEAAAEAVRARVRRPPAPAARPINWLRLRGLAPRELVRYFYRATLRRAAENGLPRRAGQTPYEYGAALADQLPEARQDIAALTDSFVAAHYSPRDIAPDDARQARGPWQRLRSRLRGLRDEQRNTNDEGPTPTDTKSG